MFRGLYIEEHFNSGLKTCCKCKRTSKLRHRATFFKFWPSGQILTSSKKLLFQIQNQHQKLFRFMMVIKKFIFCCFGVINDPLHASPCILMCLACYDSQAFHWFHLGEFSKLRFGGMSINIFTIFHLLLGLVVVVIIRLRGQDPQDAIISVLRISPIFN